MSEENTMQGDDKAVTGDKKYWPLFNFRMPPGVADQLRRAAKQRMISVSALIRSALYETGIFNDQPTREEAANGVAV